MTLRRRGEARAEDLADVLRITVSAVRQHLQSLAAADLVVHRDERMGPGRPRRSYALGPAAEALFPKAYGELTVELLSYVDDEDPAMVARDAARLRDLPDFDARVAEVARSLDEDGYLADFCREDDGTYRLTEHNCAILAVAQRYGHACASEISFLRELLPEADVNRVGHILSGSHACVYELRER